MNEKNKLYLLISVLKKNKWQLGIGFFAWMVFAMMLFYQMSFNTATAWFSFNFEEASRGLNPNGSYFNAYELKTEPVLSRALELAGVTELSVDDLMENIIIELPQNRKNDYIVTQYKVTYKRNTGLKSVSTESMLQMISYAYLEYFYKQYTDNREILQYKPSGFENLEYRQIATYYYTKMTQMTKYLQTRLSTNRNFEGSTGMTFQALVGQIENMLQVDVVNFRSYVTERGIHKSKDEFVRVLNYKNAQDDNVYDVNEKTYNLYKECIEMYEPKLTGIVLVPSVDNNQDFYMSKTKTGIDHLAENSVAAEEEAEKKLGEIRERQLIIDSIANATDNKLEVEKAEKMIDKINDKMKLVSQKSILLDNEYSRYKNKDYITTSYPVMGISGRVQMGYSLMITFVLHLLFLAHLTYKEGKRHQEDKT